MRRKRKLIMTPQEDAFIDAYVASGDAQYAGTKAGYAAPSKSSYKALARPDVHAEIIRRQQARLTEELLPLAVECLNRLITDKRTPAGAAFNAAKYVIDRGLGAVENMDKEPHEMSPDELAKQIQQLRDEAAKRSGKIIDVTPVDITPQSAGIFD